MAEQPWLPATWDRQADVVVVGFGAAGAAVAVTAYEAGAKVILLEKAPYGHEGGNTRVAGQGYLHTSSIEKAMTYLHALCEPYSVPDPMVQVWAEEMCQNNAWVESIGGDPQEHQHQPIGIEFPELPGADCVHKFHHGPVVGYSYTWGMLAQAVRAREIEILYTTPGKELIQHGVTKDIFGVRAERDGKPCYIAARRAVVLTCGGFENNQEMIRNYLPGLPYCYTSGSPYNEGDGVSMAIAVGPDGKRFADEKYKTSHGKVKSAGRWTPLATPCPMFMICDHTLFASGPLYEKEPRSGWNPMVERYDWSADNGAELAKGWIKKAETITALAQTMGLSPAVLEETVTRWNVHCRAGVDGDFGRTKMLSPIQQAPFYAVELSPSMLNTQGGPR